MATPGPGSGPPAGRIGHYRLVRRLGAGGMGVVYLGFDEVTGMHAAIKVIRPELAGDPQFRTRLRHEVAAARRVPRFCTAPLLAGDLDADPPWVATEFIDGPTLDAAVLEQGRPAPDVLLSFAAGVAVALREIHRQGVIHRDLKPSNILLSPLGPRVIDFGIARVEDSMTRLTRPGGVVGTPAYMAPEQLRGESATTAADIFAWASVVSYAADGRPPFGTGDGVMHAILYDAPDLGTLDGPLRNLVVAAFHKVPAARPSAADLVDALAQAAPMATNQILANAAASPPAPSPPTASVVMAGSPPALVSAGVPMTGPPMTGPPPTQIGTTWQGPPRQASANLPWIVLGAVTLAMIVAVVTVVALWPSARDQSGGQPPGVPPGGPAGTAEQTNECVPGEWVMTHSSRTWDIAGIPVLMTSDGGTVMSVRTDGTGELDYGSGLRESGTNNGLQYEVLLTGRVTYDYRFSGTDTILTSNQQVHDGELVVWLNGLQLSREAVVPITEPIRYACDGDDMILYEPTGTSEWART